MNENYNDLARKSVILGLGQAGMAGKISGGLVDVFWPDSGDGIWAALRARVEALIQQKIDDARYDAVALSLKTLKTHLDAYHERLADSASQPADLRTAFDLTQGFFREHAQYFQWPGHEMRLLVLFAQFATLRLGFLRDVLVHGAAWGCSRQRLANENRDFVQMVDEYRTYARHWVDQTMHSLGPVNSHDTWVRVNAFVRDLRMNVVEPSFRWQWLVPGTTQRLESPLTFYSDQIGGFKQQLGWPEPPAEFRLKSLQAHGRWSLERVTKLYERIHHAEHPNEFSSQQAFAADQSAEYCRVPWVDGPEEGGPWTSVRLRIALWIDLHGHHGMIGNRCVGMWVANTLAERQVFHAPPHTPYHERINEIVVSYPGHILSDVQFSKCGGVILGFHPEGPFFE